MHGHHFGGRHAPTIHSTADLHVKQTYFRLLRYARPYLPWVALVIVLAMFTAFVGILPQQIIGVAVNELVSVVRPQESSSPEVTPRATERARRPPSQIPLTPYVERAAEYVSTRWLPLGNSDYVTFYVLAGTFLALFLLSNGITIVQGLCMAYLGQSLIYDMRNQVYAHVQKLSLSYFEEQQTGDVMSRVVNDVNSLSQVIVGPVVGFLTDVARLFFLLYFCFLWDWQLTTMALLVAPILMLTTYFFGGLLRKSFRIQRLKIGELNGLLQDNISGIRVIMGFAREEHEGQRFREKNRENYAINFRLAKLFTLFRPIIGVLNQIGTILVLCVGGIKVLQGDMDIGMFVVFFEYLRMIYGPITGLTRFYNHIQQALASSERVFELLDTEPAIQEKPDAVALDRLEGQVAFHDVSFDYGNGIPVLRNIDLEVKPGEMIAFVGPSGAGKTTVTNLIPRFYDPSSGSLEIDGHDLRNVALKSLRSQMGIVQQDPFLFNDTVRNNIGYGRLGATEEEIIAAAKAANAHEFIVELPELYETVIGERGVKLSGGQRQRLSIARAILADPRILLLDEATSSVDTETEILIQRAIDNLVKNRTTFVIAHRLSTIQHADRIIVLDQGKMVEMGTHGELMAMNGLYTRLYEAQFDLNGKPESPDQQGGGRRGPRGPHARVQRGGRDPIDDLLGGSDF